MGYINHPRGEKVTKAWLEDAEYQIESRGKLYNAELHLKTPFDSANNRLHGFYEADQGLVQHQEQKLLDYRNLLNRPRPGSPTPTPGITTASESEILRL